jgi:hypothetical protein
MNFFVQPVKLLAIILVAGCVTGCHESGTWKEDAKNWKRIFRASKPADIAVVHSQFWRSPHWTYEFEYFLQVAPSDEFKKTLFHLNKLKRLTTEEELRKAVDFFGEKPTWFLPKAISNYGVWKYEDQPDSRFRIFIDRETGDLFLTDFLV